MRFAHGGIAGLFVVSREAIGDERGFFSRVFCKQEFADHGLIHDFSQSSVSFSLRAGTVRGMHYSVGPRAETKLVRCTAGAICDVLVDIRRESPTFGLTRAFELDSRNGVSLYIPHGVAHGFQTLLDDSEVLYAIDQPYDPTAARGIRWDDPFAKVEWPLPVTAIAERDQAYPDFGVGHQ